VLIIGKLIDANPEAEVMRKIEVLRFDILGAGIFPAPRCFFRLLLYGCEKRDNL
jgi:hypothetical protein